MNVEYMNELAKHLFSVKLMRTTICNSTHVKTLMKESVNGFSSFMTLCKTNEFLLIYELSFSQFVLKSSFLSLFLLFFGPDSFTHHIKYKTIFCNPSF